MNEMIPISVMIVDDHEIYRDGLRLMLKKQPEVELVGEAENGKEALQMAKKLKPEIILMDIVMPVQDGVTTTRQVIEQLPGTSVIALSMFNEDNLVIDMLEAGAKGYLLKNSDKKEILAAILSVHKQVPYYCSSTSTRLASLIAKSKFANYSRIGKFSFSDRELEIIRMICQEYTNKQMAEKLFLSTRTVEGYRLRIQEKVNAKTATGIVIFAIRHGIFKVDDV